LLIGIPEFECAPSNRVSCMDCQATHGFVCRIWHGLKKMTGSAVDFWW